MKHCVFCGEEYDYDVRSCYRCKEYKGLVDGPAGYDEHELDRKIADHIDGYDRDDLGESPDY